MGERMGYTAYWMRGINKRRVWSNAVVVVDSSFRRSLCTRTGGGNARTARNDGGECESAPAACGRVDSTVWDWPADTPARPPPVSVRARITPGRVVSTEDCAKLFRACACACVYTHTVHRVLSMYARGCGVRVVAAATAFVTTVVAVHRPLLRLATLSSAYRRATSAFPLAHCNRHRPSPPPPQPVLRAHAHAPIVLLYYYLLHTTTTTTTAYYYYNGSFRRARFVITRRRRLLPPPAMHSVRV